MSSMLANRALTAPNSLWVEVAKVIGGLLEKKGVDQAIGRTGPIAALTSSQLANRAVTEARALWPKVLAMVM